MVSRDDIARLMSATAAPAVSVFLPTHIAGREIRQDPIRLRNLLGKAEERLVAGWGLRRPDAAELLAPGQALVEDGGFWRHQRHGLAVFLAPGASWRFRVPAELREQVVVARQFHVRPLLPLFTGDGQFLLLCISAGRVRLFQGTRFGMVELHEVELPESLLEVSAETDYEETLHAAPPARPRSAGPVGMPSSHGFGESPEELRKSQLIEFLRRVASALEDQLGSDPPPLVLAAHPEIQGNFRAVAQLKTLLPDGVAENPDALDEADLHRLAYEMVRPSFLAGRDAAIARFRALRGDGDGRAASRIEDIVGAAHAGRIDSLFLVPDGQLWGRFDETDYRVEAHGSQSRDDVDLLDDAAARTLEHGGQVYLLAREDLPPGAMMAATLRY